MSLLAGCEGGVCITGSCPEPDDEEEVDNKKDYSICHSELTAEGSQIRLQLNEFYESNKIYCFQLAAESDEQLVVQTVDVTEAVPFGSNCILTIHSSTNTVEMRYDKASNQGNSRAMKADGSVLAEGAMTCSFVP